MPNDGTGGGPKRPSSRIGPLVLCCLPACDGDATGPGCDAGIVSDLRFGAESPVVLDRIMGVEVLAVQAISECGSALAVSPSANDWSSDAPAMATGEAVVGAPTPLGLVRAVGFGDATISATVLGVTAELAVQVLRPDLTVAIHDVTGRRLWQTELAPDAAR